MNQEQKDQHEHQEWAREQEFEAWKQAFSEEKPKLNEEQQTWVDAFKEAFGMRD